MWFNRAALKAEAKACMRQSKANPYITALVYILISYILALLANRLVIPDNLIYFAEDQYGHLMAYFSFDGLEYIVSRPPLAYVIYFLIDISSMMLGAGMVIFVLNVARRAASSVGNLFDGFVQFPRIFLLYLAEGLFIFLWSLLFVIPGIIAAYRYRLAIYLLLEHPEMGVMACIRESKRLMAGRKGELFVLDLSFLGWSLLEIIPYVGMAVSVYVTPYRGVTMAGFYLAVTGVDSRHDPGGRYGREYEREQRYEEQHRRGRGDGPWDN